MAGATAQTMTVQSPFSIVGSQTISSANDGYDIVTSVTAYTATFSKSGTAGDGWGIGLFSLRPTGGAPAGTGLIPRKPVFIN